MVWIVNILYNLVRVYSFILVVYALLSWFPGAYQTSLGQLILRIVEPVLKPPFQRFNLQFAGIDWTVLVVIFLLNFVSGIILNALLLLA